MVFSGASRSPILSSVLHSPAFRTQYRSYSRSNNVKPPRKRRKLLYFSAAATAFVASTIPQDSPTRTLVLACQRCSVIGIAVTMCIIDYKMLFRKEWSDPQQRHLDYKACHKKCAERILHALQRNGGIYIKLGQHLSSVQLVPVEWSSTFVPLQDANVPTPQEGIRKLFLTDVGASISDLFDEFDPNPIGVASLAQVHVAIDKATGQKVAVKIMHPELQEFVNVDIKTTRLLLDFTKSIFPNFEFTWLGEEMEENLPLEMDFRHEAANARRCVENFKDLRKTTLVVPNVLWAKERVLVMEFAEGARVDDLKYLHKHHIDRNRVSQELSRIFSKMLYLDGWFHADPHAGNLLIRPAKPNSRSPYNFEIVLLDHGLYFDIDQELRTNYARLWLSLIKRKNPKVDADRRKYAKLVGNIDDDMFPIFESAITGRAGMDNSDTQGSSMMDLATKSDEEAHKLRMAVLQEGMLESIFELLRRVPRRLLMVLKLNDLTRSLDASLNPTHPPWRIWLIVARYCALCAWRSDITQILVNYRESGPSLQLVRAVITDYIKFQYWYTGLKIVEMGTDVFAGWEKAKLWMYGMSRGGLQGATEASAGLLDV